MFRRYHHLQDPWRFPKVFEDGHPGLRGVYEVPDLFHISEENLDDHA